MSAPDTDALEGPADTELVPPSTAVTIIAPLLSIGAALAVRKFLDTAYRKATGSNPPKASDPDARMSRILVYAAATAAAVAIVNVAVDRLSAPRRRPIA